MTYKVDESRTNDAAEIGNHLTATAKLSTPIHSRSQATHVNCPDTITNTDR